MNLLLLLISPSLNYYQPLQIILCISRMSFEIFQPVDYKCGSNDCYVYLRAIHFKLD